MSNTIRYSKDDVRAVAGDWMLLQSDGEPPRFASKVDGLDIADCPTALLMRRADGEFSQMSRVLLGELADAGNPVIALCLLEDFIAKARR